MPGRRKGRFGVILLLLGSGGREKHSTQVEQHVHGHTAASWARGPESWPAGLGWGHGHRSAERLSCPGPSTGHAVLHYPGRPRGWLHSRPVRVSSQDRDPGLLPPRPTLLPAALGSWPLQRCSLGNFRSSSAWGSHTARAPRPDPSALLNSSPRFHGDNKKTILSLHPKPWSRAIFIRGTSGIWRFGQEAGHLLCRNRQRSGSCWSPGRGRVGAVPGRPAARRRYSGSTASATNAPRGRGVAVLPEEMPCVTSGSHGEQGRPVCS